MKLSEIITRVQRQFGDEVQAQITKEDIVRWTNDACLEIATSNSTNQGILATTAVEVGKTEYDLPSDLLLLRSVRVNGLRLQASTYEQLNEIDSSIETTTGVPTHYWVYDGKLYLYPMPVESLGNISVMYVKTPDILHVNMLEKQPDVPVQYHPRIVEYCIAQAAELDDNIGHYQLKINEFKQNILNLNQNATTPESDGYYPSITYVQEGLW